MGSRKLLALVLAIVGPWGAGQFYLGHRRRGLAWLGAATVALGGLGCAIPALGPRVGWGVAVLAPLLGVVLVWAASLVDLARAPEGERVPWWQIALFFAAGIASPLLAAVLVRAAVLEAFVVPTESMQPALLAGDRIFADRRDRQARYGDVIVFASPEHPDQTLIKRVVARPGDVLEMRDGHPFINGWKVPSCALGTVTLGDATGELEVEFLGDASYLAFYDGSRPTAAHAGPLYAAKDAVLVLGDDRNDSADSRSWHKGIDGNVHASSLRGRALFVWLRGSPLDARRFGMELSRVDLPTSLEPLEPALRACLAARPSATPPKPLL